MPNSCKWQDSVMVAENGILGEHSSLFSPSPFPRPHPAFAEGQAEVWRMVDGWGMVSKGYLVSYGYYGILCNIIHSCVLDTKRKRPHFRVLTNTQLSDILTS
jgi:hypothetical protein